jgi:hypothetical protein
VAVSVNDLFYTLAGTLPSGGSEASALVTKMTNSCQPSARFWSCDPSLPERKSGLLEEPVPAADKRLLSPYPAGIPTGKR